MALKNNIVTGLKGFCMGAANVVPGVSGGTIALITGIFSRLVASLDSLMKPSTWKLLFEGGIKSGISRFWKKIDGTFLLSLSIGVLLSIVSLAKVMEYCLAYHPIQTWAFFFGLILASSYIMFRDIKDWKIKDVFFAAAGVLLGLAVCTLSPAETPDDMWFIFVCGAVAICTMILPGISGSFVLVILGKYDYVMSAISGFDWPVLAVFALGCIVGIAAFTKLLHWLLEHCERQTMLVLLGFVLGSLIKVWPWSDKAALADAQVLRGLDAAPLDLQMPSAILFCIAGVALILVIDLLGKKKAA